MADIVIIQPDTYFHDKLRTKPILPLGPLTANCYTAKEYSIKLIDMRLNKNWILELKRELKRRPFCVAFGVITGRQILSSLKASKIAKEYNIPVVWGGHHPTLLPRQTIENHYIDYVIKGEGEITFYELIQALERNKPLNKIKGLLYKKKNKIHMNKEREFLNLDLLPELPYHIVNIKDYLFNSNGLKTLPIETSRGCKNKCSFCHNVPYNKSTWRGISSEKFIEKLNFIRSNFKEVKCIEILDDHFNICNKRSQECLKKIKTDKFDFRFYIPGIRINDLAELNNNQLKMLEEHCNDVIIGLESGSQRIQDLMEKDIQINKVIEINKKMNSFDICLKYNLMSGFPTETRYDTKSTINIARRLIKDNKKSEIGPMNAYRPIYGTKMYTFALKHGLKEPVKLESWVKHGNWGMENFDNMPWLNKKRKEELKALLVVSSLLAPQSHTINESLNKNKLYNYTRKIYMNILEARMKSYFFKFMPEKAIYQFIRRFIEKTSCYK